jgi:hypothetical protein
MESTRYLHLSGQRGLFCISVRVHASRSSSLLFDDHEFTSDSTRPRRSHGSLCRLTPSFTNALRDLCRSLSITCSMPSGTVLLGLSTVDPWTKFRQEPKVFRRHLPRRSGRVARNMIQPSYSIDGAIPRLQRSITKNTYCICNTFVSIIRSELANKTKHGPEKARLSGGFSLSALQIYKTRYLF